jgi:hypothetical protein
LQDESALVLFELLARHEALDKVAPIAELRPEDPAELYALWEFHASLERTLVEPFREDYSARLEAARASLRTRWGMNRPRQP